MNNVRNKIERAAEELRNLKADAEAAGRNAKAASNDEVKVPKA